ncbi:hypothetical protein ACFLUB_03405 [Chloroflexota bacterium]
MEQILPYMKYLVFFVIGVIVLLWAISVYFVKTEKMSVKEWSKRSMGLPQGTVRALIAFIILFLLAVAAITGEDFPELPDWLIGILGAVIGFYFGAALAPKTPEAAGPETDKNK